MLNFLFLSACGQPGPLYLPADEAAETQIKPDSGTKEPKKDVRPEAEQAEPDSELQTDQYYPY